MRMATSARSQDPTALLFADTVLAYYPYPLLRLPGFDPVLGFATLGLAWPAAVLWPRARA